MKKIKGTFSFFYNCFICYTLVVYALLIWVPFSGWVSGFMMMTFPVIWLGHVAFLLIAILTNRKNVILPLIVLLLGCFFLPRTYSFGSGEKEVADPDREQFKLMSYNVHVFQHNADTRLRWVRRDIRNMKKFIINSDADILCMPEYYNSDASDRFNTDQIFREAGYKYKSFVTKSKYTGSYWGLAVLSKLPIIAVKDTLFVSQNGMIKADIKTGNDTVTVIALHMYSMTLQLDFLKNERRLKEMSEMVKIAARQIKKGFTHHADEMKVLESWIQESSHPVIVCGDFNETPYGYVYGKTRSLLNNSFEEKGAGFGFTYNHLPYYIRIDHQFYDKSKINLMEFSTIDSVRYSDHYPLMGTYQIAK